MQSRTRFGGKPLGVQEPIRIYFENEESAADNADDTHPDEVPEISASYIIFKVGQLLGNTLYSVFSDLINKWSYSSAGHFASLLTLAVPFLLFMLVTICLPLPFPLGIVFLLKILETKPVAEQSLDNTRGLIAARIVLALRTFHYQFTSYIARVSGKRLREFFENETFSGLLIGWVLVFPALFIFLLVITVLLLPFSFLLHPCPSILRTKHEE